MFDFVPWFARAGRAYNAQFLFEKIIFLLVAPVRRVVSRCYRYILLLLSWLQSYNRSVGWSMKYHCSITFFLCGYKFSRCDIFVYLYRWLFLRRILLVWNCWIINVVQIIRIRANDSLLILVTIYDFLFASRQFGSVMPWIPFNSTSHVQTKKRNKISRAIVVSFSSVWENKIFIRFFFEA